ncbi:MAG: DegT/DnrJ/EryC1/StrS family aminotransferase [Actinomycetota bacterium]
MLDADDLHDPEGTLTRLVSWNQRIHEHECVNLNPAANVMNPAAETLLSAPGLGTRPSLGDPGHKYEMGLEAVERIEVLAEHLAREVFDAAHAEVRLPSGAMANLVTFLAASHDRCSRGASGSTDGRPGVLIAPPASIAGHVTHHADGAAGLVGFDVIAAPVDRDRYTVDVDEVATLARRVEPSVITVGASLNLRHHPVAQLREVADEVGAVLVFDAAHLSGLIAGGVWPNPLAEGAHAMTMSTYKSLAGPPAGLVLTDDERLAERIRAITFPGLTANFDVGATAALARTLIDWHACGGEHAAAMVATAAALADGLLDRGIPVHRPGDGGRPTESHAFAVETDESTGPFPDGHTAATTLRRANLLTSAIGVPTGRGAAIRIGTNEMVRWGLAPGDVGELADLVARAWGADTDDEVCSVAAAVTAFRRRFDQVHFTS